MEVRRAMYALSFLRQLAYDIDLVSGHSHEDLNSHSLYICVTHSRVICEGSGSGSEYSRGSQAVPDERWHCVFCFLIL